jgi:hypothetical protein
MSKSFFHDILLDPLVYQIVSKTGKEMIFVCAQSAGFYGKNVLSYIVDYYLFGFSFQMLAALFFITLKKKDTI